jgi:hypothetical protein
MPKFNTQLRYVKRISFILQPRLTNESDANLGHSRQVNMYIPMNRVCMYDWTNQSTDAALESASSYQVETGQVANTVEPKRRLYLMVRALNPTVEINPSSASPSLTPSYDIMIRNAKR